MPDDRIMAGDEDNLRHVFRQELQQWMQSMPDADADMVSRALASRLYSSIVAPVIKRDRDENSIRFLAAGEEVTTDAAGVSVGTLGKSEFDIMNIQNSAAWIESSAEGRRINYRAGGGGTDCMFDWIVSTCWATEVAAGRGAEGQLFTSLTGCSFYVTSTVQQAWDGVGAGAAVGLKNMGTNPVCFICPGDAGPLAITTDASDSEVVTFWGSGIASQINATSTNALSVAGPGTRKLVFRFLWLGNGSVTRAFNLTDGANVTFDTCRIGHSTGLAPIASDPSGQEVYATDCEFITDTVYSVDMAGNGNDSRFLRCSFSNKVRPGVETKFVDCRFNVGFSTLGVEVTAGTQHIWLEGCEFRGSGSFLSYITATGAGNSGRIHVVGCWGSTSASTQAILIAGTGYLQNGTSTHLISGNRWQVALGLNHTGSDTIDRLTYVANQHESSAATDDFIYAQGKFNDCVFEANGPARGYVSNTAPAGINRYNGIQNGAGTPTHTATESQEYWDYTNDLLYINTSAGSGTTWALAASVGGPPAVHAFVGASHSGDDDYTLTPGVLGLGVSTGDLKVYSDAGITQVAQIDGATGHVIIGASAPVVTTPFLIQRALSTTSAVNYNQIGTTSILTRASGTANNANSYITSMILDLGAVASYAGAMRAFTASHTVRNASAGVTTLAELEGFVASATVNGQGNSLTVTDYKGLWVLDPSVINSGAITTAIGIRIDALTAGGTNIGISNASTSRLIGGVTIGADTVAATTADIRGAVTLDGVAASGTPAADDIVVYNETATDFLKAKDDNGAVYNLTHKHTVTCVVDGTVTNQKTVVGPMPQAGTITASKAKTCDGVTIGATAWIGQAYLIPAANIDTDGGTTTLYSTAPSITNGHMVSTNDVLSVTTFAAGDYFSFATTQVGTSATMIQMGLTIRFT